MNDRFLKSDFPPPRAPSTLFLFGPVSNPQKSAFSRNGCTVDHDFDSFKRVAVEPNGAFIILNGAFTIFEIVSTKRRKRIPLYFPPPHPTKFSPAATNPSLSKALFSDQKERFVEDGARNGHAKELTIAKEDNVAPESTLHFQLYGRLEIKQVTYGCLCVNLMVSIFRPRTSQPPPSSHPRGNTPNRGRFSPPLR